MNWLKAITGALKTLFLGLLTFGAYRAGKDRVRNKVMEETIEDVEEANEVEDRLNSDPEYVDRVRERFTR